MKYRSIAALTACSLLLGTASILPASAGYGEGELTFALRPVETADSAYDADGNTAFVSAEDAEKGLTIDVSMFIEAEYADLIYLYASMYSSSPQLTFCADSLDSPTAPYTSEKVGYTLSDGTVIPPTTLKPYCFGYINNSNVYVATSPFFVSSFSDAGDALNLTWMYGMSGQYKDTASFLGTRSDAVSFVDFQVALAAGTQPGVYEIAFKFGETADGTPLTAVESDDSAEGQGYSTSVPQSKNLTIVVEETPPALVGYDYKIEQDAHPLFFSEDTAAFTDAFEWSVTRYGLYADGTKSTVGEEIASAGLLHFNGVTPADLYTPGVYDYALVPYVKDEFGERALEQNAAVQIGLRGDVNRDEVPDAADAAAVLVYAAEKGAGGTPFMTEEADRQYEELAKFTADVDKNNVLDAADAAVILVYAAEQGAGRQPVWDDLIS